MHTSMYLVEDGHLRIIKENEGCFILYYSIDLEDVLGIVKAIHDMKVSSTVWALNRGKATRYLNFIWTFISCNGSSAASMWWPNGICGVDVKTLSFFLVAIDFE